MNSNNYYAILNVPQNATFKEILEAYRKLAKRYHPDLIQDPISKNIANEKFKKINEANEVLSDRDKRPLYDRILPPPPTAVQATPISPNQVNISWTPVSIATGYNIYRNSALSGSFVKITSTPVTGTTFTDNGVSPSSSYHYCVTSITSNHVFGESVTPSNIVSVTTPSLSRPFPPTAVQATPISPNQVNISWTPVSIATGYNIYRNSALSGSFVKITSTPVTGTTFTDNGVSPSSSYHYGITSVNVFGESVTPSNTVSVTTPRSTRPLAKVIIGLIGIIIVVSILVSFSTIYNFISTTQPLITAPSIRQAFHSLSVSLKSIFWTVEGKLSKLLDISSPAANITRTSPAANITRTSPAANITRTSPAANITRTLPQAHPSIPPYIMGP